MNEATNLKIKKIKLWAVHRYFIEKCIGKPPSEATFLRLMKGMAGDDNGPPSGLQSVLHWPRQDIVKTLLHYYREYPLGTHHRMDAKEWMRRCNYSSLSFDPPEAPMVIDQPDRSRNHRPEEEDAAIRAQHTPEPRRAVALIADERIAVHRLIGKKAVKIEGCRSPGAGYIGPGVIFRCSW